MTKKENTQALIIPETLQQIVNNSGLSVEKASNIASNYVPLVLEVQEQIDELSKLSKGKLSDVSKAKRIKLDLGKICSQATKIKKFDKENLLVETRFIDTVYNAVEKKAREAQSQAEEIEKHFEKLEAEKKEKLKNERLNAISKFLTEDELLIFDSEKLGDMNEDIFEAYLTKKEKDYNDRIIAEKEAEEKRLAEEKINRLHNERKESLIEYWQFVPESFKTSNMGMTTEIEYNLILEDAKKAKIKYDIEQENIRKQNEELRKQAKELERATKVKDERRNKLQPYIQFIRNYNDLIDAEDVDFEKQFADIKRGAEEYWESERKEQLKAQKEEEQRQKEEKERTEKLEALKKKGDKIILESWIKSFTIPDLETNISNDNYITIYKNIELKFEGFKKWALNEVK